MTVPAFSLLVTSGIPDRDTQSREMGPEQKDRQTRSDSDGLGDHIEEELIRRTHLLSYFASPLKDDHLVGLVVKASASRAEGPGFESRLRRDFFGVESYQ